ncbi:MAG TPA: hypothetical protein VLI92_04290 [Candidatus Saccharimonadales bacterium]|nr:hypothetical protein [Candidatus Saccharimonadales bacterium]
MEFCGGAMPHTGRQIFHVIEVIYQYHAGKVIHVISGPESLVGRDIKIGNLIPHVPSVHGVGGEFAKLEIQIVGGDQVIITNADISDGIAIGIAP